MNFVTTRGTANPFDIAGVSRAAAAGSDEPVALAKEHVRAGEFDQARALFEQCIRRDPRDARALLGLSALRWRERDRSAARSLLRLAVEIAPVTGPARPDPAAPVVLRTRCVDSADYRVGRRRNGEFKLLFKGGHFSISNLLLEPDFDLYVAHILEGRDDAFASAAEPDLLLNTMACADRGQRSLAALGRYLAERPGLPVINRPEAVARTTRDGNYRRLGAIEGVRFPRTERLALDAEPAVLIDRIASAGFSLPLIVRSTGRHTGRAMWLCTSRDALSGALAELAGDPEAYVIQYFDCRAGGVHRKARAFFIDGKTYPVAYLASDEWQIHSGDRYRVMSRSPALQAEERRYLADPAAVLGDRAYRALERVGAALELDFAGVDFTVTPDGELIVFEANPAMRHNFDYATAFPYTRPHLQRISDAFAGMVDRHLASARARRCNPTIMGEAGFEAAQGTSLAALESAILASPRAPGPAPSSPRRPRALP